MLRTQELKSSKLNWDKITYSITYRNWRNKQYFCSQHRRSTWSNKLLWMDERFWKLYWRQCSQLITARWWGAHRIKNLEILKQQAAAISQKTPSCPHSIRRLDERMLIITLTSAERQVYTNLQLCNPICCRWLYRPRAFLKQVFPYVANVSHGFTGV
jgi:hypothetical protein